MRALSLGDVARILEPMLLLLLQPKTQRTSIQCLKQENSAGEQPHSPGGRGRQQVLHPLLWVLTAHTSDCALETDGDIHILSTTGISTLDQ